MASYTNYQKAIAPVKGSSRKVGLAPINPLSPLSTTARYGKPMAAGMGKAQVADSAPVRGSSQQLAMIAAGAGMGGKLPTSARYGGGGGGNPGGGPNPDPMGGTGYSGGNDGNDGNGGYTGSRSGKNKGDASFMDPFAKWPRKDNQSKGIKETWHRRFKRKPGRRGSSAIAGKQIYALR